MDILKAAILFYALLLSTITIARISAKQDEYVYDAMLASFFWALFYYLSI